MATNTDAIASSFLRALAAPDTPQMRAAVTAWLRQEGISSVKRNNPWNLHQGAPCGGDADRGKFCPRTALPGQIGVVNVGPGDKNVAVFATLDAGVAANARNLERLSSAGYGYDRVIAWARAGDPVNFLHSLALSSWSAGRYGTRGGGPNKLVTIYNGITGAKADPRGYTAIGKTPTSISKSSSGTSGLLTRANDLLTKAGISTDPEHVITGDEARAIASGLYNVDPDGTIGRKLVSDWTGKRVKDFTAASVETGDKYEGSVFEAIAGFLGAVLDPANWVRILAIVVGLVMAGWGGMNLLRSAA